MEARAALLPPEAAIPLKDLSSVQQSPSDNHITRNPKESWYRSTKWFWSVRVLSFLVVCIAGPITLRLLDNHFFQNQNVYTLSGIQYGLPCDVEPLWSSWASLFEINLRTGKLSFTAAKIIDAIFDLIVGRGGQLLLAWHSGLVYRDVLTRLTEQWGVDLKLFIALALDPHSLTTLWTTLKAWRWRTSRRGMLLLTGVSLTSLYVVFFPTLMSTATSLVAATVQGVQLPNGDTMSRDELLAAASYMFNNTGLTAASDPWIVKVSDIQWFPENYMEPHCDQLEVLNHNYSPTSTEFRLHNGTNYTLGADTRIGCGFYLGNTWLPADTEAYNNGKLAQKFSGPTLLWKKFLICVPEGNKYQWGASWELIMLIVVLHIVWSLALIGLAIEANRNGKLAKRGWVLGRWRAIADTGTVLHTSIDEQTLASGTERDIQEAVDRHPLVLYDCEVSTSAPSVRLRVV